MPGFSCFAVPHCHTDIGWCWAHCIGCCICVSIFIKSGSVAWAWACLIGEALIKWFCDLGTDVPDMDFDSHSSFDFL